MLSHHVVGRVTSKSSNLAEPGAIKKMWQDWFTELTARNSCRTGPEAQELPPASAYTDPEVCAYCETFLTEENRGGSVYNNLGERETWCSSCLLDKYWSDRQEDLRETDRPEDYNFHGMTRFGEPEW